MSTEEYVLTVPTKLFESIGYFQGFCGDVNQYIDMLLAPENVQFRLRSITEKDPSYKQLIPYMLFSHKDESGNLSLFHYVRGKGMGESRLHSKRSVGVGGHVSSVDWDKSPQTDFYREGMLRELQEEIVLDSLYRESCIGLINDDSTDVGKVHLGIVHLFELDKPNVRSNEPDLLESGFVPLEELRQDLSNFESWSAICIEALLGRKLK
ncbi:MAG: phosphoesterase [Planctomycetaceae bacterium]|nr:phosphoesterase [Planctomycetaceae bacterium]